MLLSLCTFVAARALLPQDLPFADVDRAFPRLAHPIDLELGDLDGDLDVDALVATGEGVFLVRQLTSGAFDQPGTLLADSQFPNQLGKTVLFDADGDTDLDLYLGRYTHAQRLLLNDGAGAFLDASALLPPTVPSFGANLASAGDLDGDGDRDLLVQMLNDARLWRNQGVAGFTEQVLGPFGATEQELADVDGDGDLDRLSGTPGACFDTFGCFAGGVALSLNDGTGAFASATFPATELFTRQLAIGDADADGDLDVVAASGKQGWPTRLFRNGGAGAFALDIPALPAVPGACDGAVFFDAEADGDADLYLSGHTGGSPMTLDDELLLNGPAGYAVATVQLPAGACCESGPAQAADLDGDLDQDLMVRGETPRVLLQQPRAFFADATPLQASELGGATWLPGSDLVLGDLDGDGAADGARGQGYYLHVLRNDGAGELEEQLLTTVLPSAQNWSLALPDVDGDGDLDLYSGATSSPHVLWRNDGAGGLTAIAGALPSYYLAYDSDFFDADGDGDLDLATTDINNVLLVNDGTGQYSELPTFPFGGTAKAAAAGDFDGDGDVDLVAQSSSSPGFLYRNDPGDVWTLVGGLVAVANANDIDAGDIDGDGALDLLVTRNALDDLVALGDGAGGFAPSGYLPPTGFTQRGALADLDGDGDLDAATRYLWENTGSAYVVAMPLGLAQLEIATPPSTYVPPTAMAIGDLDADGDLDVLYDRLVQLENLERATTWRSLAGLGRPLVLGLHGDAATPWVLGWSLGSASLVLPPFGTLQLDPAALNVQAAGVLSATGLATPTIAVPPSASLIGLDVHWQAVVGAPLRFTDRTTTTLLEL